MTATRWAFFVEGKPQTQGSMKGYVRGKRAILVHSKAALVPWRQRVANVARAAGWLGADLLDGPIYVHITTYLERPACHFDARGELKHDAPLYPHRTRKDADKFARAIGDALTRVVWTDDCRIVDYLSSKRWGRPGVLVEIEAMKETA